MVNAQKYIRMHFEIHSDERIISFECVRGFIRMKQSVHSNEFPKPFETHFQRLKHQFLIHNRSAHCLPKKEIKECLSDNSLSFELFISKFVCKNQKSKNEKDTSFISVYSASITHFSTG